MQHGSGIEASALLAQSKDLDQETISNQELRDSIKFHEECYEGDFRFGKRHGVGRLYKKDGSYFYGFWQCGENTGDGRYFKTKKSRKVV
jgi:hypothetical protein